MNFNWAIIRKKLYSILLSPGKQIKSAKMYDESGTETIDPIDANRFFIEIKSFSPQIDSYKILAGIRDKGQKSYIEIKIPKIDNKRDFDQLVDLINHIRQAIGKKEGIQVKWQQFDKEIDTREEAMHNINESKDVTKLTGTTKSSFQNIGTSKMIVRHSDNINEEKFGARTRHIKAIFVETKNGERFRYPHLHMSGARAFARHLHNGGTNHDQIATGIFKLSEDYLSLRRVVKEMRLLENAMDNLGILRSCMESINRRLKSMHGPKGYENISRELINETSLTDMDAIDSIHKKLAETCQCQSENPLYTDLGVAARYMSQQPNITSPDQFTWSKTPEVLPAEPVQDNNLYDQIMGLANSCSNPYAAEQLRNIAYGLQATPKLSDSDKAFYEMAVQSAMSYKNKQTILDENIDNVQCPEEVELDEYLNEFDLQNVFEETDGQAPSVHDLSDLDDGEVYDITQTNEEIKDGDVLKMSDGRVAILCQAWPCMVVGDSTVLHKLKDDTEHGWMGLDGGKYAKSYELAMQNTNLKESGTDVDEGMWDNIKKGAEEFWHGTEHEKKEKEATKQAFDRYKKDPKSFKDKPVNEPVDEDTFWDNVKLPNQPKKPEDKTPQLGQYQKNKPEDIARMKKDLEKGDIKLVDKAGHPVEIDEKEIEFTLNESINRIKKLSGI